MRIQKSFKTFIVGLGLKLVKVTDDGSITMELIEVLPHPLQPLFNLLPPPLKLLLSPLLALLPSSLRLELLGEIALLPPAEVGIGLQPFLRGLGWVR